MVPIVMNVNRDKQRWARKIDMDVRTVHYTKIGYICFYQSGKLNKYIFIFRSSWRCNSQVKMINFFTMNQMVLGSVYVCFLLTLMESYSINTCTMSDCSHGAGSCCRCCWYETIWRKEHWCLCMWRVWFSPISVLWIIECCWALRVHLTNMF